MEKGLNFLVILCWDACTFVELMMHIWLNTKSAFGSSFSDRSTGNTARITVFSSSALKSSH